MNRRIRKTKNYQSYKCGYALLIVVGVCIYFILISKLKPFEIAMFTTSLALVIVTLVLVGVNQRMVESQQNQNEIQTKQNKNLLIQSKIQMLQLDWMYWEAQYQTLMDRHKEKDDAIRRGSKESTEAMSEIYRVGIQKWHEDWNKLKKEIEE